MSRFQFRLARVLRVREVEEQAARERYLAQDAVARAAEARAEEARQACLRALEALRGSQDGPLELALLLAGHAANDRLRAHRNSQAERARTLRFQAEAEQRAWAARRRDVRALERLEDRDRERWREVEARAEARVLDEVGSLRSAARARGQGSGKTAFLPMERETTA